MRCAQIASSLHVATMFETFPGLLEKALGKSK
jgi:hypothetical protein